MALITTSLNSGSNGNCYYVGNESEAVIIDAGLSCRETERRMQQLGLSMKKVKAIFISHEHSDHIKGVQVLSQKYDLPVHISSKTYKHSGLRIKKQLENHLTEDAPVTIGRLSITAFTKFHDAADPHSFSITCDGVTVGVFTDIGKPCDKLISHFSLCHAAYLETNYDEAMLENGRYPVYLKNRIRGGNGHLSNNQALEIFKKHKPAFMTHLFPAHLSKDNNSPELVERLFNEHAGETKVIIASRYEPIPVFNISNNGQPGFINKIKVMQRKPEQLRMF